MLISVLKNTWNTFIGLIVDCKKLTVQIGFGLCFSTTNN